MISDNYTYYEQQIIDPEMGEFNFFIVLDKNGEFLCETRTEENAALIVEVLNRG